MNPHHSSPAPSFANITARPGVARASVSMQMSKLYSSKARRSSTSVVPTRTTARDRVLGRDTEASGAIAALVLLANAHSPPAAAPHLFELTGIPHDRERQIARTYFRLPTECSNEVNSTNTGIGYRAGTSGRPSDFGSAPSPSGVPGGRNTAAHNISAGLRSSNRNQRRYSSSG